MLPMFPPKVVGSRIFHRPIYTNANNVVVIIFTAKSSLSLSQMLNGNTFKRLRSPLSSRCTPKRIAVSRNMMNRNPSPVIA